MSTPESKVTFQKMLQDALAKSFPGTETSVEYLGVTGHEYIWRVTVAGTTRELTQRETTVLLRGHDEEFRSYFQK
jgi:hypothetical protein